VPSPSQHDSDPPTKLLTLIDLRCTPQVPGIHLPWTYVTAKRAQRAMPLHPTLLDM
jgi:hypothetical protein